MGFIRQKIRSIKRFRAIKNGFLYGLSALVISVICGCSSVENERCIDINKISESDLTKLILEEIDKILTEEEHFYRRTLDDSEYEIIEPR